MENPRGENEAKMLVQECETNSEAIETSKIERVIPSYILAKSSLHLQTFSSWLT